MTNDREREVGSPRRWWETISITCQETTVLRLSAEGRTSCEIARRMGITENTVEEYWKRLRRKLRARNKVHAVAIALHLRLIQWPK